MIQESIVAMSKRREWLADHYLPESTPGQIFGEDGDLTPEQEWGLMAINALEEEYVLDPELRERISLITFTDD